MGLLGVSVIIACVGYSLGAKSLIFEKPPPRNSTFSITDSMLDFTVDLSTNHLGKGNLVFSPFSITNLLNLLLLGATDRTYHQLRNALKYPVGVGDQLIHQQSGIQLVALQRPSEAVTVTIANRIFADNRFHIKKEYQLAALDFYQAAVESVDFARARERATARINQWVNKNTNGKIPKLLPSPVPSRTRMVAVNVVYFNSSWQTTFDEKNTRPRTFNISPNETILTDTMLATSMRVPFGDFPEHNFSCLALPYTGGSHGMYVFLPDEAGEEPLARLERHLTAENLAATVAQMQESELDVQLPRFKMQHTLSLRQALRGMGVMDLFRASQSSLKRFTSSRFLYLDEVLHEAVVDVHERGTEAAAATSAFLLRSSFKRTFSASRPFVFIITDTTTGVPLFWGRLVRPEVSPSQA